MKKDYMSNSRVKIKRRWKMREDFMSNYKSQDKKKKNGR